MVLPGFSYTLTLDDATATGGIFTVDGILLRPPIPCCSTARPRRRQPSRSWRPATT